MTMPWNEVAYKYFSAMLTALGGGTSAQQVQGNTASEDPDAGNPVKVGGRYDATLPTYTTGDRTNLQTDSRGNVNVNIVGSNSANVVTLTTAGTRGASASSFGITTRSFGYRYNGTTWDMDAKPNAASRIPSSAASVNATVAKASAGEVFAINGYNASAGVIYLKLYNKATAPTVGTDTPVYTLALPPTATFSFNLQAQYFSTGIGYGLTTGAADADATAVGAGDILGLNIAYA